MSRKIDTNEIVETIKNLCIKANTDLGDDVISAFKDSIEKETSPQGQEILRLLIKNAQIAKETEVPICQDTGFAVVFLEVGQEISFEGGALQDAINEGVRQGYNDGYLRKSIIKNPLTNPVNTNDNTPAIIHTQIVPGDKLKITVAPKGGGAENMSRLKMLKPADGIEGVRNFVMDTIINASANPCPPLVIGVGVGGTFEKVAYLAKKALMRDIGQRNGDSSLAKLESDWLKEINHIGIGPAGLGGKITALDLFIEEHPRHIATLPAAVNIQCHAHRHKSYVL